MHDHPLISVIVPVYNVEQYLDRCVRSLVEQTYPNLEIILVDDGSTDKSGTICDEWAKKDGRIRVIHQQNAGAGAARNTALHQARGELIGFADSDDYLEPHMYACLYDRMDADTDIAECDYAVVQGNNFLLDDGTGGKVRYFSTQEAMLLHIRDMGFCQTIWNKLYRRETVAHIDFPVGNLIDDEFWTYRALANARRLARVSSRMYAYRQQPQSVMHRPYSLKRLQGLDAKWERLNYLEENMPQLTYEARYDLFFSCLFTMQSCLRYLKGVELATAKEKVQNMRMSVGPLEANPLASRKRNLLLKAAQISFENTCTVMNILQDIHLLR